MGLKSCTKEVFHVLHPYSKPAFQPHFSEYLLPACFALGRPGPARA